MVRPILQRHRTARLALDRARRRWRLHAWQHILFSDESRFSLRFSDGRDHVYRRRGERFTDQYVMIWTVICHYGRTQLKIIQGTLSAVKYRDDDNARCHLARVCQEFLNQNHVRVLP